MTRFLRAAPVFVAILLPAALPPAAPADGPGADGTAGGDRTEAPTIGATIPAVPAGRPRVYLNAADLAELRTRIGEEPYRAVWERIRDSRDYLNRALVSLVEGDRSAGRTAIVAALEGLSAPDAFEYIRHFDSAYHKAACVYDWCYPLLTDAEKRRFVELFTTLPNRPNKHGNIYIGYPARMDSNPATGHQNEGYLLTSQLPAGLAIHDEEPTLYDAAARLFFEKFLPVRRFHYRAHAHHQGTFYGVGRFQYDLQAALLFRALGAGDVFPADQRFVPYYHLYMRQPEGTSFPVGDAIAGGNPDGINVRAGSYYRDPYLLGLADERTGGDFGPLFDLLFRDHATAPRPIAELPLTKHFPSPAGATVARTGWDLGPDSRDAAAYLNVGEYFFGNHQHYDAGTFQISYRGPLAIASGYYDDFAGEHGKNYYNSAISKNALLIRDPDGVTRFHGRPVANDGGQSPQPSLERPDLPAVRTGRVTARAHGPDEFAPDYSLLAGDVTDAYGPDRAERVTRAMVALNLRDDRFPLALVVCDRVIAKDPAFEKVWLLHSVQEPVVGTGRDGRKTITVVRTGPNRGTRNVPMPAGAEYGGRLTVDCLLPINATVNTVGGPGREFWVDGRNYPPEIKPRKGRAFDPGAWQVEVTPPPDAPHSNAPGRDDAGNNAGSARETRFLHVLTVSDIEADVSARPPVDRIAGDGVIGVRVGDRLVLFPDGPGPLSAAGFAVPAGGPCDLLVCGLEPGRYALEREGETVGEPLPADAEGRCVYVRVRPGRYRLTGAAAAPPTRPADFWDRLRHADDA